MIMTHKTKGQFKPKRERPFIVETTYLNGACHLINQDNDQIMMPNNGKFMKKYYNNSMTPFK